MNERIKQLAEQYWEQRPDGQLHFDNEKFAELIVRECLQICKDVGAESKEVLNASEDYQKGREMGAEVCHNMIKKHFGVK